MFAAFLNVSLEYECSWALLLPYLNEISICEQELRRHDDIIMSSVNTYNAKQNDVSNA